MIPCIVVLPHLGNLLWTTIGGVWDKFLLVAKSFTFLSIVGTCRNSKQVKSIINTTICNKVTFVTESCMLTQMCLGGVWCMLFSEKGMCAPPIAFLPIY